MNHRPEHMSWGMRFMLTALVAVNVGLFSVALLILVKAAS